MIYFTSDTHFNDPRFELMDRPFSSTKQMNKYILRKHRKVLKQTTENDTFYHLGDFAVLQDSLTEYEKSFKDYFYKVRARKILILGNYEKLLPEWYRNYFDEVKEFKNISSDLVAVHKPEDIKKIGYTDKTFSLVGHIHGAWKIQRKMINVGVDVHHFNIIDYEYIWEKMKSIKTYYDINAFAGEMDINYNSKL